MNEIKGERKESLKGKKEEVSKQEMNREGRRA